MKFSSTPAKVGRPGTIQEKASLWQRHMEDWKTSGLTQAVYCQQHDISLASFGYWRTRLKRTTRSEDNPGIETRFLPVQLRSPEPESALTLRASHGLSIDLSIGFDPQLLGEVLRVLVTIH